MNRLMKLSLSTVFMLFIGAAGRQPSAYIVCNDCGCHINHAGCYWYPHDDNCNPNPTGPDYCFDHPEEKCKDIEVQ